MADRLQQLEAELAKRERLGALEAELARRSGGAAAPAPVEAGGAATPGPGDVVNNVPEVSAEEAATPVGPMPIPEPVSGPEQVLTNEQQLSTMTGGMVSRPTFEAVGGTVGAALAGTGGAVGGLATGPGAPVASPALAAAGVLAGDALGSAAGSLLFDTVEDAAKYMGIVDNAPPEMQERLKDAYGAGRDAAIYGPVAQAVGIAPSVFRKTVGKVLGAGSEAVDDLMRAARNSGVMTRTKSGDVIPAVGLADAASGGSGQFGRIYLRATGIFPFLGGPVRKAAVEKRAAVGKATDVILNKLAPNATLQSKVGVNMADAAENTYDEFRRVASVLYGDFRFQASQFGAVVPSKALKAAADDFAGTLSKGNVTLTDGSKLPEKYTGELVEYIRMLRKLPDNINMDQFDSVVGKLGDLMDEGARNGSNIAFGTKIKTAAEDSLADISEPSLREAYDTAQSFYSKGILNSVKRGNAKATIKTNIPKERLEGGMANFKTPTAKKFARADKKMFEPGFYKAGTINKDELINVVDKVGSPEAMRDLRKLVGDEQMGALARDKISRGLDKASIRNESGDLMSYSGDAFRRSLGLTGDGNLSQEAFEELLSSTQVNVKDFNDLLKVMDSFEIPKSVSQFIARRAGLGGMKSLLSSAAPLAAAAGTGTVAGGPVGTLMAISGTLFLRYTNRLLSSPEALSMLRKSVLPSATQIQKRQMLGRVIDYLQAFEERQSEPGTTEPIGP